MHTKRWAVHPLATRSRSAALGLGVAALVACACAPVGASASTIAGRLADAKSPAAGKGFTTVRAVRAQDLVIVAVAKVRSGRFRLKVPAGSYRLFAATTPFRGKAGVDRSVGRAKVGSGKRKTMRLSLRKRSRRSPRTPRIPRIPGLPSRPSASAAFVAVKYPAVWVKHFSVSGPAQYGVLRKGLADMLITDFAGTLHAACKGVVVEREHLAEILTEQLLQQGPNFDPTTRVATGKIIAHNREVTGSLNVSGTTATLTATVTNVATGGTRSVTRSGAADRPFELEQSIVQEVIRLICGDKPPAAYSGQASGSTSGASGSSSQTLSWNGDVRLRYTDQLLSERSGEPDGEYALYEPESGGIHVILDGVDGDCTYHGETDVSIIPAPGEYSRVQQGVDEPAYSLLASFPAAASLPYTITGPEHCAGSGSGTFPLGGRVFLNTQTTQKSSSSTLTGTTTVPMGPVTVKWGWSLNPQAT